MPSLFKRIFSRTPMAQSTSAYDFGLQYLDLPPQPLILDIGAGQGNGSAYLSRRLPEAQVVTYDITMECFSRDKLDFGPNPPWFIQADATAPPLASNSLDAVLAIMTFHCLPQPQEIIAGAARMLRPGGMLLIADVNGRHWMGRPFEIVEHLFISPYTHAYTAEELRALCENAGLTDFTVHQRPDKERGFMQWVVARKPEGGHGPQP